MSQQLYEYFYGHGSANERLFLVINHWTSPLLDAAMPAFTFLGSSKLFPLYLTFLVLIWLVKREAMPGSYPTVYFITFCLSLTVEKLLKEFFHVPRPPLAIGLDKVRLLVHLSHSFSLPSGHSIFAFMTATVLGYARRPHVKLLLFLFALFVAWSRIYLGVHYPLDVVTGALVGMVCGLSVWKAYEAGRKRFVKRQGEKASKDDDVTRANGPNEHR